MQDEEIEMRENRMIMWKLEGKMGLDLERKSKNENKEEKRKRIMNDKWETLKLQIYEWSKEAV